MNRLRVSSVCGEGGTAKGFPFVEDFSEGLGKWALSRHDKYANQPISIRPLNITKYPGGDNVLYLEQAMKHYGLAAPFTQPIDNHGKELVVQYEVKFDEPLQCGGAYIKLFSHDPERKPEDFDNETPYVIMFGPDRCGGTNKVHFILRHQNPVTGEWEEKHGQDAPTVKVDKISHLYTLVVRPDNSYEIFVDQTSAKKGSLLVDMQPPVNPPKMIDDPEDKKPEDWVDTPKIPDPDARKPDDWDEDAPREIPDMDANKPEGWLDDETEYVADPEAERPADWDEEEDGEWEAPMVPNAKCEAAPGCGEWVRPMKSNPEYKGKWSAPLIDNPAYKGVWKPRQIENPYFFTDDHPHNLPKIGALAVEIWTTNKGIQFDNFLVAYSEVEAFEYATSTWKKKFDAEKAADVSIQKESRSKEIAKKKTEGGWRNLLEAYALEAVDFAQDQPKAVTGTLVALLVTMIFLTLRGGRATRQPTPDGSETEGTEKAAKEVDEPTTTTEPSGDKDKDEDEQEEDDKDK